ncbi:MAG: hypothetical protein R3A52_25055 [Polyangiales bacterium]
MSARPASVVVDAALHALALVPLAGPASLQDPRYAAWARASLPPACVDPTRSDAPLIAALAARAGDAALALQSLPWAWGSVDDFTAAARDPIAPSGVPARESLRRLSLAHPELCEIARCAVALCLPAYARAHAEVVAPLTLAAAREVDRALDDLASVAPAMHDIDVVLAFALGGRGRALDHALTAGVPHPWNALAPEDIAQQCLHERAVTLASALCPRGVDRWRWVESVAVRAVDLSLDGSPFAPSRERWRARHDLSPLGDADPRAVVTVCAALTRGAGGTRA